MSGTVSVALVTRRQTTTFSSSSSSPRRRHLATETSLSTTTILGNTTEKIGMATLARMTITNDTEATTAWPQRQE